MARNQDDQAPGEIQGEASKSAPLLQNRIVAGVIVLLAAIFAMLGAFQIWEDVAADDIVVIQAPFTGELHFYTSPGTVWQNFGTVTTHKRRSAYEFDCKETKVERVRTEKTPDGKDMSVKYMGSVWTGGVDIRFNDGGHGTICGSLQYEMPSDHEQLRNLYQRFKGQAAIEGLLKKQTDSAIYLAGQLMSSRESYNETRNDLIHYISDQIQNGVYRTRAETVSTTDTLTQQQKQVNVGRVIMDSENKPQRQEPSALHTFGVKIFNFTISRLPYDDQVEAQIQQQQRLTMDVQTSLAEFRKAEQRALTVVKEGEANAAEAKWRQETIKAQKVTEAQQEKEVHETNAKRGLEVAKLDRQAAEQTKEKDILLGQGQAEARRLILEADGALSIKVDAYKYTVDKFSDAMARYQGSWVPQIVLGGHGDAVAASGAMTMMDALTIQALKSLGLDIGVKPAAGMPAATPKPTTPLVSRADQPPL